jgi:sulfur-oxidizing protein SoxY
MRQQNSTTINMGRRKALKATGGFGLFAIFASLGLVSGQAWAGIDRKAFDAKTLTEAFAVLGNLIPTESVQIKLTAPDIAENGAVVPITVESFLPHTEQISILVDKNPTTLVTHFQIPDGLDGFITTRIKMAQTSLVVVLVKADGKFYRASKEVQVTAGGC